MLLVFLFVVARQDKRTEDRTLGVFTFSSFSLSSSPVETVINVVPSDNIKVTRRRYRRSFLRIARVLIFLSLWFLSYPSDYAVRQTWRLPTMNRRRRIHRLSNELMPWSKLIVMSWLTSLISFDSSFPEHGSSNVNERIPSKPSVVNRHRTHRWSVTRRPTSRPVQ